VTLFLLALAGGIGAAARLILSSAIHRRVHQPWPIAMSIINISGAFVLGLALGMVGSAFLPREWNLVLGVGLVGGFTAFSTSSFHTLRLLQDHRRWLAILNSFGMIVASIAVAGAGLWLGRVL
jgi:CrcB protein